MCLSLPSQSIIPIQVFFFFHFFLILIYSVANMITWTRSPPTSVPLLPSNNALPVFLYLCCLKNNPKCALQLNQGLQIFPIKIFMVQILHFLLYQSTLKIQPKKKKKSTTSNQGLSDSIAVMTGKIDQISDSISMPYFFST